MRVSIVVPARNEARRIVATLASLQAARSAGHEVIVVDGGSTDATLALASRGADRAFAAPPGRAAQMNAGAAAAAGDVLLFLHADSLLPADGVDALLRAIAQSGRRWGRFDVTIAGAPRVLSLIATMMNARSTLTGVATGDQGIFVVRALFEAVGGFPDQPLMEDIELSRRLKRAAGRPLCLPQRIVTSGRRWERDGPWRTIVAMWRIRFAYWRGADPARLAARYGNTRPAPTVTLQVFARNPVPGQVKTRLAAAIGDDEAAALYAHFVERALETAVAARAGGIVDRVELWGTPDADAPAFTEWRDRYGVVLRSQSGDRPRSENETRARTRRSRTNRAPSWSAPTVPCSTWTTWRGPSRPSTITPSYSAPRRMAAMCSSALRAPSTRFPAFPGVRRTRWLRPARN